MITKPVKVSCPRDDEIIIGIQMENNHRQFVFDCSVFDEEVSSIMLVHQRSKDEAPYVAATSSTDTLVWTVTSTDTTYAGYGKAELRVSFANGLAKSETYITRVLESITGDTVIPDPLQSWYDALIEYIDDHAASPEQIEAAVEAYLEEHPIPAPVTSVNGKLGDVVLSAADVGAVASETDPVFVASPAYGITAADITGWNAKSDFSGSYNDLTNKPTIPTAVSELENDSGYITSAPVDSVNGKTGAVVLSASDVGAYVKPVTGIPKNDLASDVQTSLNKADTALQSAPVTSVNSKTGAVTLNAADVGALPASYVAPVISVNGQTGNVTLDADDVGALPDSYTAPVASVDGKTGTVTILPTGGTIGQVLAKASGSNYDVEWVNQSGGGGAVDSVNGQTGVVVLDAEDVGAQPTLTAGTGITITNNVISSTATGSVQTVNSQQPDGNGNVVTQRELTQAQYDALTPEEKNNGVLYMITDSAPSTDYYTKTETDGLLANKQNVETVQSMTASDTSVALQTDKFYVWPEMSTLTVTVTATGMYAFRFTSGATPTTLTVTGATMPDSFTVEANKVYEINIYQGYGVAVSWTAS